jgi:hypothetical protein
MKAPQFILYVVFLICSSFLSKAQFISIDEARHKVKKAGKAGLFVDIHQDEKNPLIYKILINHTQAESIMTYLRPRNSADFIEQKDANLKDSHVMLNLHLAGLEDGEYTFVVKTENQFFIKHFLLTSGDLVCEKVGGKEVLTINRQIQTVD